MVIGSLQLVMKIKQRQYCNKFNKDFKISNLNTTTKNNLAVLGTYQHHLSDLGINLSF